MIHFPLGGLLPTMLHEAGLLSASWRWGEGRWFTQSTQIEFLFIDCFAVLCTNSGTSYKLVNCSATEVQPSPTTSFLLVNFPFLVNHYSRKRRSSFRLLMSRFTTRKFCSIHKTHMSHFTPSNCRGLPWDNCNLGGETLPTLPTYSFSLFFWTWPILKRNLSCCLPLCSLINHKPLALSGEAASPWAFEAGHLTPC